MGSKVGGMAGITNKGDVSPNYQPTNHQFNETDFSQKKRSRINPESKANRETNQHSTNHSINQSTNQPFNQPTTNQPINQPPITNQPVN